MPKDSRQSSRNFPSSSVQTGVRDPMGAFIFLCRMEHDLVPGLSFSHVAILDEYVVVIYL